jgi:hypothetical protein
MGEWEGGDPRGYVSLAVRIMVLLLIGWCTEGHDGGKDGIA